MLELESNLLVTLFQPKVGKQRAENTGTGGTLPTKLNWVLPSEGRGMHSLKWKKAQSRNRPATCLAASNMYTEPISECVACPPSQSEGSAGQLDTRCTQSPGKRIPITGDKHWLGYLLPPLHKKIGTSLLVSLFTPPLPLICTYSSH